MPSLTKEPVVSVVIPAFNAAATISDTLASVFAQTLDDFEVIVVDDGSSDGTAQVVSSVRDTRIRIITQPNQGVAAARNTGIEAARGGLVAFVDADDLWLPAKLERQVSLLRADPRAEAVQTAAYFVNSQFRVLSVRPCVDAAAADILPRCLRFENLPAFPSSVLARRESLVEIGMFDPSLVILEDWDLALRFARRGSLRAIEEPLVLYRVHPGNRSRDVGIHIAPGQAILRRLFEDPTLPPEIRRMRRQAYGSFYRMIAGGYLHSGRLATSARWALRAIGQDPRQLGYAMALPLRRIQRAADRLRHPNPLGTGPA